MTQHAPILIAGPTASGKSALALALAERLGGTVINADAMQVYRELRVLTARPDADDERRAPHRLYGHVPGAEAYSAARYAAEARAAIAAAEEAGSLPIVVGGTGLYFKALTEGLSPIPPIPDEIRARWRACAGEEGAAALHAILAERDPEMAARLRPTDPQRLVRALEVLEATGTSLARWQEEPGEPVVRVEDGRAVVVAPERDVLRQRIDARFDRMMAHGAVEEVRALLQLALSPELPVMRALGVGPLARLIAGEASPAEAGEAAKAETRQYAKRQLTWLRRNMNAWKWIDAQEMESFVATLSDFIKSKA
jgi:tRNA dimethylallyltransferase